MFCFFHLCLKPKCLIRVHPLKNGLLMWACLLQVHAVCFPSYILKCWLLIGGICLMHNFVVGCTNRQTGWDAHGVSIYDNAWLSFLEWVLSIVTIFYLLLLKIITILKRILRYHSVPNWFGSRASGEVCIRLCRQTPFSRRF